MEAIHKLPVKLTIRADIANLTAEAALHLENIDVVHRCYKAALLIVALGEVLKSNGTPNEKMKLIEHNKKIHSRKRAFKEELKELI